MTSKVRNSGSLVIDRRRLKVLVRFARFVTVTVVNRFNRVTIVHARRFSISMENCRINPTSACLIARRGDKCVRGLERNRNTDP